MTTYLNIVQYNFLRFFTYPLEIVAAFLKWAIEIGFILLFWTVVAKSSNGSIDIQQLVVYFVIANSIDLLVDASRLAFAKSINHMIKLGEMNNYLIKPMSIVPHIYSIHLGKNGLSVLISLMTLAGGLLAIKPISPVDFIFFVLLLILAIIISFSINLMVGLMAFYSPEVMGIRFTITHIIRVFSGAIVPLSFFPDHLQSLLSLTFLPGMVYGPTAILTGHIGESEAVSILVVSAIWAAILLILAFYLWAKAMKIYDAVGI